MAQKQQNPTRTPSEQRKFDDAVKARAEKLDRGADKNDQRAREEREQRAMDEAIDESFPASDPPAHSSATTLGPSPSDENKDARSGRADRKH